MSRFVKKDQTVHEIIKFYSQGIYFEAEVCIEDLHHVQEFPVCVFVLGLISGEKVYELQKMYPMSVNWSIQSLWGSMQVLLLQVKLSSDSNPD